VKGRIYVSVTDLLAQQPVKPQSAKIPTIPRKTFQHFI